MEISPSQHDTWLLISVILYILTISWRNCFFFCCCCYGFHRILCDHHRRHLSFDSVFRAFFLYALILCEFNRQCDIYEWNDLHFKLFHLSSSISFYNIYFIVYIEHRNTHTRRITTARKITPLKYKVVLFETFTWLFVINFDFNLAFFVSFVFFFAASPNIPTSTATTFYLSFFLKVWSIFVFRMLILFFVSVKMRIVLFVNFIFACINIFMSVSITFMTIILRNNCFE